MALSNGRGQSSGPLIFLQARSQDKEGNKVKSHFEISRRNAEGKIEKSKTPEGAIETCTRVTGDLQRPRFSTREWQGNVTDHITLYLSDTTADPATGQPVKETYSIDCTYRIATRALFNAILSLTDPKGLEISLYDNKAGYETLSLWQNGKMVPWKFDGRKGEIPEPTKVTINRKEQNDWTAVNDFFRAQLDEWADRIFGPEKKGASPAPAANGNNTSATDPAKAAATGKAAAAATNGSAPKGNAAVNAANKAAGTSTAPVGAKKNANDEDVPF